MIGVGRTMRRGACAVKYIVRCCILLAVTIMSAEGIAMSIAGDASRSESEVELLVLERQFGQAVIEADLEALDRLVGDEWVIISPDGKVLPKAAFIAVLKSGALTHSAMELDETRVRVYGDVALVTGRAIATGAFQGQAFTTRERSTDVFVRQQGQWRCVLTQLTTIAEK
jgi:ketosteroid isomerase-like protein